MEFKAFVPQAGYCRCRHRVKLNEDGSNPCRCCAGMWPDDEPFDPDDYPMTDTPDQPAPSVATEATTPEMLDEITDAYVSANMKCDDDTGMYDVQPDCKAKQAAARIWLLLTGVGLLIDEVDRLRADLVASRVREEGLRDAGQGVVSAWDDEANHESWWAVLPEPIERLRSMLAAPGRADPEGDSDE